MASDSLRGLRQPLAALATGLVSAGLALSIETSSLWRLIFLALAPLPLFVGGLSAGPLTSLAGGLTGAVLVTAAAGSVGGGTYLGAVAFPIAILVWQALRSVQTEGTKKVWYSGGNLVLWLAGLGLVGVFALIGYFAVAKGGLAVVIDGRFDL